jgi:hypothetical protein
MLAPNAEKPFVPLDAVPFQFVDTPAAFDALLLRLRAPEVTEIAIDLEAHNMRSYHGFCCLMQVWHTALLVSERESCICFCCRTPQTPHPRPNYPWVVHVECSCPRALKT